MIDEDSVGGDYGPDSLRGRMMPQLIEILSQEGFSAGKKEHWNPEAGQVIDQGIGLRGSQLLLPRLGGGIGIAVEAGEVAATGHVPDHHRSLVLREPLEVSREACGLPAISEDIGGLSLPTK
jgi:hypothetical protein